MVSETLVFVLSIIERSDLHIYRLAIFANRIMSSLLFIFICVNAIYEL